MAVYAEFSNATNINGLLAGLQPYLTIDPLAFYTDYFNITTCNRQGLDNWGRILNQPGTIYVPDFANVWGFDVFQNEPNPPPHPPYTGEQYQNFNNGNFYGGQVIPYVLPDPAYRALLLFKYNYYTTNATLASINFIMNTFIQTIYPTQRVAVTNTGVMEIQFAFNFYLDDITFTLFNLPNILPVPAGVGYTLVQGVIL